MVQEEGTPSMVQEEGPQVWSGRGWEPKGKALEARGQTEQTGAVHVIFNKDIDVMPS